MISRIGKLFLAVREMPPARWWIILAIPAAVRDLGRGCFLHDNPAPTVSYESTHLR